MTREEQLACLEDRPCAVCKFYTNGCSRWFCVFEENPEEQETKIEQWIPVTERLPEERLCDDGYVEPSNPVLICFSNGAVLISRYWGNRRSKIERPVDYLNWIDQPSWRQDPIAWMPLPQPYKAQAPERDCEHCVHRKDKGCEKWNCEFERRQ